MHWFKHFTSARTGCSLNEVYGEFGEHVGYACYFWLVEYCGSKVDAKNPKTTFVISQGNLKEILKISDKKILKFLKICKDNAMFDYEKKGNVFYINFPHILDIADEYISKVGRKSRQTPDKNPDNVRTKSGESRRQELELELELELEEKNKINTQNPEVPEKESEVIEALRPPTPLMIFKLWNDCVKLKGILGSARELTDARKKSIVVTTQHSLKTIQEWEGYFHMIWETKFLLGQNNRSWKATFNWVIKRENALKVLEGAYPDAMNDEGAIDWSKVNLN